MLRSYIVIPFTEEFGDFSAKWKGLKSLCIATTYQQKNGEPSGGLGVRYFISSKDMKAEEFGKLCRGHWGVESMHWWLDAVMNEDDSRITYKYASENLSRIRQICMNFIKLVEMKGTLKRRQLKCVLNTEFREREFCLALKCFQQLCNLCGNPDKGLRNLALTGGASSVIRGLLTL